MDGDDGCSEHSDRSYRVDWVDWIHRLQWRDGIHGSDWNDGGGKYCDGTHWRDRCDWV
jgi:hypothetical protein